MAETEETAAKADDGAPAVVMVEPVADAVTPPAPPPPSNNRRGGLLVPLLGGALAAGLGFGLAQYVPGGWPMQDLSGLQSQLASQADIITRLEARLATVEGTKMPDISPLMETLSALNSRVAGLENGPAERAEEIGSIKKSIAALQTQLAALPSSPPVNTAVTGDIPANVAALAAEAEARLKEAEAQAAAMKAEAEALTRAAVAQAAFGRLQAAVDAGTPYAAILPDLGLDLPDALKSHADTGLPSLASLQTSFPDAARLALEAALRADMGDSWTERATSFFRSQTGVRSLTPREGSDPDAILSRAEAALGTGDLATALTELATLPEAARAPMADWQAKAEARQAGVQALGAIAGQIGG